MGRAGGGRDGRPGIAREGRRACMYAWIYMGEGRGQGREPARMSGRRGRKEGRHAWNYAAAAVLYSETMGTRELHPSRCDRNQ